MKTYMKTRIRNKHEMVNKRAKMRMGMTIKGRRRKKVIRRKRFGRTTEMTGFILWIIKMLLTGQM